MKAIKINQIKSQKLPPVFSQSYAGKKTKERNTSPNNSWNQLSYFTQLTIGDLSDIDLTIDELCSCEEFLKLEITNI